MKANDVDFRHPLFSANVDNWNLVDNICDSKNLRAHLIPLNPDDDSSENVTRNNQFARRAVFAAIAGYTSRGLVGKAFTVAPKATVPDGMDYVNTNIDGMGVSINQQAQEATTEVTRLGRAGLLVDFPKTEGELSRAALAGGDIFSTITLYKAKQVINWQTTRVGAQVILSKVVLAYQRGETTPDGFGSADIDTRLELSITGGVYTMTHWQKNSDDEWVAGEPVIPSAANGKTLSRIPFFFIGSNANTQQVDFAPMFDLAKMNIGHYNNSAIYEDSVFTVGQAQPWMSGLNQESLELMTDNNMYIGSGRLIGVPSGEKLGFAQATENPIAREAMLDKVSMMVGLGAMLIQPGGAVKTATQVTSENQAQHSVLSLITANVSEAYTDALKMAAEFMGENPDDIIYEISDDFIDPNADANMLREVVATFMAGAMPVSDFLRWQQRHGFVDGEKTLEEFNEETSGSGMVNLDA
tara:strand:+ start:1267 stop:2673 length:1407 start_codon:yes stop_codon:yes gene_type:complete